MYLLYICIYYICIIYYIVNKGIPLGQTQLRPKMNPGGVCYEQTPYSKPHCFFLFRCRHRRSQPAGRKSLAVVLPRSVAAAATLNANAGGLLCWLEYHIECNIASTSVLPCLFYAIYGLFCF